MDTQDVRHRGRTEEHDTKQLNDPTNKKPIAKRGLKSLSIAVLLPLSLMISTIYLFGTSRGAGGYWKSEKPFWIPPASVLHVACVGSSVLMGLAAWLVWVDGGFHRKPMALYLYLGQLGLSLVWSPIVFKMGASLIGLIVWLGEIGALVGCYRVFGQVNKTAADLIRPCLGLAALVALVNASLAHV